MVLNLRNVDVKDNGTFHKTKVYYLLFVRLFSSYQV